MPRANELRIMWKKDPNGSLIAAWSDLRRHPGRAGRGRLLRRQSDSHETTSVVEGRQREERTESRLEVTCRRACLMIARNCALLFLLCAALCSAQTPETYQVAKVMSVRQVRHASFPTSRYPTTPYYTLDLAVLLSGQTDCADYETPVLDEVRDLLAASGHNIQIELNGKKILLILPAGRRLKAELVKSSQC